MNWRIAWLIMTQTMGVGMGLWLHYRGHPDSGFFMLLAVAICTMLWLVWDNWLGMRMLRWLKKGNLRTPPWAYNLWAEVADTASLLQRKHRLETRQAQEKLDAFLEAIQAAPIGVVLLDELGRMEWFNQIAAQHFGFQHPQDLNQHIINLLRDPVFVPYWMQPHSGNGVTIYGRQHSVQRPVKLAVQFFGFGDGKRLLLSRDVTAVEQADRMRRDFVSNVSHEIRTPLTVLAGFVETLQTLPLQEADRQRYLGLMAEQAQRMQVLVEDLLTLSRLEGSPPPDTTEHVDVAHLLAQCVNDAQALSRVLGDGQNPQHHISASISVDKALQITGSQVELRSAVGNLLSNAVRYTPAGGSVMVSAQWLEDGQLCIAVNDTGPGIAREYLPRITERFYRIDKSRSRDTGGTGLGLAIVKHVAQRHGATLEIDSQVGHGTTFSLVFPQQRLHRAGDAVSSLATLRAASLADGGKAAV